MQELGPVRANRGIWQAAHQQKHADCWINDAPVVTPVIASGRHGVICLTTHGDMWDGQQEACLTTFVQ